MVGCWQNSSHLLAKKVLKRIALTSKKDGIIFLQKKTLSTFFWKRIEVFLFVQANFFLFKTALAATKEWLLNFAFHSSSF